MSNKDTGNIEADDDGAAAWWDFVCACILGVIIDTI
jgi:hypothetical protein